MRYLMLCLMILSITGCAVVSLVDTAVSTTVSAAGTVAKVGIKTAGAAAEMAIPDSKDKKEK